jgi:hypothetical protein
VKTFIQSVASRLAIVALGLFALAAPARAGKIVPNGPRTSNGLSTSNGPRTSNGLCSLNGLRSLNGLCPPTGPCAFSQATSFVGIWKARGIDPARPRATALALRMADLGLP